MLADRDEAVREKKGTQVHLPFQFVELIIHRVPTLPLLCVKKALTGSDLLTDVKCAVNTWLRWDEAPGGDGLQSHRVQF